MRQQGGEKQNAFTAEAAEVSRRTRQGPLGRQCGFGDVASLCASSASSAVKCFYSLALRVPIAPVGSAKALKSNSWIS